VLVPVLDVDAAREGVLVPVLDVDAARESVLVPVLDVDAAREACWFRSWMLTPPGKRVGSGLGC
jgi:hypothetical protein